MVNVVADSVVLWGFSFVLLKAARVQKSVVGDGIRDDSSKQTSASVWQLRLLRRVGHRVGLAGRFVCHIHKWYLIDQHSDLHVLFSVTAASLSIQTLGFSLSSLQGAELLALVCNLRGEKGFLGEIIQDLAHVFFDSAEQTRS